MATKEQRCQRFEKGLREAIRTPISAVAKWTNFLQLIETALRVEQSLSQRKEDVEISGNKQNMRDFIPKNLKNIIIKHNSKCDLINKKVWEVSIKRNIRDLKSIW